MAQRYPVRERINNPPPGRPVNPQAALRNNVHDHGQRIMELEQRLYCLEEAFAREMKLLQERLQKLEGTNSRVEGSQPEHTG